LSNDQYAWSNNDTNPNANYDPVAGIPIGMQNALQRFISSVTVNGRIHPAVQSFAIGNEIDLGITLGNKPGGGSADPVNAASNLARALWWTKTLHDKIAQLGDSRPITIPISNGDQGVGPGIDKSWFQCILHGAAANSGVPHNTVNGTTPGGTFAFAVTGLD